MGMKNKHMLFLSILITIILLLSGCETYQNNSNNNKENIKDDSSFTTFNYPPFDLDKVYYIIPMGDMIGSHVTPIDHQYYVSYDFQLGDSVAVDIDVYSPGNGTVTSIQHMDVAAGDSPLPVDDFRITIQHTPTISSYYIHIDELSEKLSAVDPGLGKYASVNVEVSAGEVIGKYGGSVDYNIVDEDVELPFINPESYENEPWKIHCSDPFGYFNDEIKNQMIEKCLRIDEPIGGKICYDIDGRLVGTWFEEGTNGYAGADPERYWAGHLSVVYDIVDPDAILISIGTFVDKADQFAVKGNSPDPANISVNDGLVIYELTDYEYYKNGTLWDKKSLVQGLKLQNGESIRGTILLQLIEDRKLKVEIVPGEIASQVTGFTDNAKFYER
jgi:hypothetical protein